MREIKTKEGGVLSEQNKYFPNLFSPIKVGTKVIKNRIEAAPALFAFEHYIEADFFGYYPPMPERAYRMLEAKAKGGAGSVVLGELSPNHTSVSYTHLDVYKRQDSEYIKSQ